ncbi:MAG: carbohydrate-binding protein, partial [Algibacter sp.]|uniref:carbohydrate-binding protein n=1 Tax=Algibacter sp. TaxID=1872428 RepID=UPI003296E405
MTKIIKIRLVFILVLLLNVINSYGQLTHPGGWFLDDDLRLIRTKVSAGEEPWISGWNAIKDIDADESYTATVSPTITDTNAFSNQGHAAYVLAIKWVASGDIAYANAAKDIIDAWVNTVEDFDVYGPTLTLSVSAGHMANAAEILAWGFNGEASWSSTSISNAKTWFKNIVYPFTSTGDSRSMNWGTSCVIGNMAMAIFCDNTTMFNDAINAYKYGFTDTDDGCAGVTQYIINADGQCFESERDQVHTQGGIAHLVEPALIAWNQGVDLVSFADDRLVAGMEYTAKYNLGYDVSWTNDIPNPCNQSFGWMNNGFISEDGRGDFSPMYYLAAKLFKMAGKPHPYTAAVLDASYDNGVPYTPEFTNTSHPGMGSMCFIIDENPGDPISGFDSKGLPEYNMNELPMTIEAENFDYLDLNGQDKTYNDLTDSNEGGQYRTDENVDIESLTDGNYNITSIKNGEWLLYTVNVSSNGIYSIDINYAASNNNGAIKFNLDGADLTSSVSVPFGAPNSTGLTDWQDFNVVSGVRLSKGIQVLKVLFTGEDDAFKLNNFTVSLVEADPEETVLIQAEDYSEMNGIRTESTGDVDGGLNVGYIDAGDWMDYQIEIANSGTFILNYRVASKNGGGSVEFLVDGETQGTTGISSTGDWQAYTTLSTTVSLTSGSHTIRLNALSGGWNINWIQLVLKEVESLSQESFEKNNEVRLYPNPVSNNLTVLMPNSKFNQYTIFDISGRVNKQGVITNDLQKLNID